MKVRLTRSQRRPGGWAGLLARVMLIVGFSTSIATSQVQVPVQVNGPKDESEVAGARRWGLEPPNDVDAVAWLKRAKEAAAEGDWKLAADTLERVVAQHGDRTVSMDGAHYYSAGQLAEQQIASWPAEGLAAYRVLYDHDASRLYQQAIDNYDFDALRLVARRYAMTTIGPDAMNLLASWLLDRREAREALQLLARLETLPHSRIPIWELRYKQAIAYILSGQRGRASETLENMRSLSSGGNSTIPSDWPARVEGVLRFHEEMGADPQGAGSTVGVWRYRLGPAEWSGRLPAIDPMVAGEMEFKAPLPGADRVNPGKVSEISRKRARPPVWQAVSDGTRLFVTGPAGLQARDLATFDLLWQSFPKNLSRDPRITEHRMVVNLGGRMQIVDEEDSSPRLDPVTTQTLFHEYQGEVSTAFGLVFVIEQEAPPEEQNPTNEGSAPPNAHLGDEVLSLPNTLRAYEASTGRATWFRGRGGDATDELRGARFCAAPIAVGSSLVVPYRQVGDLMLAVLSPDGTLVRQVLLGSGRASLFPMNGLLSPALNDGTLYIPTGAGLLIALDAYDFSLRWLTKYDPYERFADMQARGGQWWVDDRVGVPQPDQWLSGPPVIAGGVVVLAAQDSDYLRAFDLEDGREVWRHEREGYRYVIGADDERIFIGGSRVAALSLRTGEVLWSSSRFQPTGRAVICGLRVMVPTDAGLLKLSTDTGAPDGDPTPADVALGNLFAMDGALYSVSADTLAKFPDPVQTQRLALARLERSPNDMDAILRLSWLASIAGNWSDAMEYLDRAERILAEAPQSATDGAQWEQQAETEAALADRISHQRVSTLLKMAVDASDADRTALLEQAVSVARRKSDRVSACIAYCDHMEETDRFAEGFRFGLSQLASIGNEPVSIESNLRVKTVILLSDQLRRLWNSMSSEEREDSDRIIKAAMQAAGRGSGRSALVQLADALEFTSRGWRIDLEIADAAMESGENETCIFFLERALRRAPEPRDRLEPLLRLVVAYRFPGESLPADIASTRRVLAALDREFGGETLPASVGRLTGATGGARVSDWAAEIRSTLPDSAETNGRSMPRILVEATRLGLLREVISSDANRLQTSDGASFYDPNHPNDPDDEVIPIQLNGELRGLDVKAEIDKPDCWVSPQRSPLEDSMPQIEQREANAYDAAICGRVAVLATPVQVCAVGLASGRFMWPQISLEQGMGQLPSPTVVGADGIVVVANDPHTLVAAYARDDSGPIWRRSWPRHSLRWLKIVGDSLVAVDRNAIKVFVIDLGSGRVRAEYSLVPGEDPANSNGVESSESDVHVAIIGDVVVRSVGSRLIGVDAKSGKSVWPDRDFGDMINGVFELGRDWAGVSHGTTGFALVRVETGEVARRWSTPGLSLPPIDAVLDAPSQSPGGSRLVLFTRKDESPPEYVLESFPLDPAELPWRRDLGPLATISRQMLRASPHFVAAVRNALPPDLGGRRLQRFVPEFDPMLPPKLELIDKSTGRLLPIRPYEFAEGQLGDERLAATSPLNTSRRLIDVIVLNDRIVCVAPEGFFVLSDAGMMAPKSKDDTGNGAG